MKELVSVVITTFGRIDSLKRAIESVIRQSYENLEIIVVDDNNDLNLKREVSRIVQSFGDSRLKLVVNDKNVGGAVSRNIGIKNSRGNLISFLDDDDEYLPERIEKQVICFDESSSNVALVYTYCVGIKENGKKIYYKNDFTGSCLFEAMRECIAATSQWLCRKDALQSVGNFSNVPCKQDSTLIVKLLAKGYEIDRVPEVLSIYHDDETERISRQGHDKRINGEETLRNLCRENYDLLSAEEVRNVEYNFYCRLAPHYFATHKLREAFLALVYIFKIHPFSRKTFSCYKHILRNFRGEFIR